MIKAYNGDVGEVKNVNKLKQEATGVLSTIKDLESYLLMLYKIKKFDHVL